VIVVAAAETGKAGPLGLLVLLLLIIASYLLFKSMSRHLRKVRQEWPENQPDSGDPNRSDSAAPPDAASAPDGADPSR
jgi:hypothetical protein